MVKTKEVKSPKELLKEAYRGQAEHFSEAFIEQICLQFADIATGKQMLEIQKVLNEKVNLEPFMETLAEFVITDAKLTDDEIMVVVDYTTSDVGQRAIKAGLNSTKYIQENGNVILTQILGDALQKLEEILEKK